MVDEKTLIDQEPEIDVPNSAVERIAAADALRVWIDERQPENRHILERLESDLRSDKRLNEWGQFALEDLLRPPRRNLSEIFWHEVASWVTFIRNIFLFVPVAITWFSIERAAKAYARIIFSKSEKTFLQVWLADADLTLQRTAFIDALIILLLIILTITSAGLEWFAERQVEIADEKDEADFREVLVNVGLFLHGFRAITPSALKSGLAEAVGNLRKSSEQLAIVAEKATQTLGQFAQISVTQLEPAVLRINSIVAALGSASASHEQMGTMVRNLQLNLGESLGLLTNRVDEFGSGLQQSLSTNNQLLEASIRGLLLETESVARNLASVATSAREVATLFREKAPTE